MGVIYHSEPKLNNPVMLACWPGIGEIGVMAAGILRRSAGAHEFAEIEPYQFFYPKRVFIRGGELKEMEFPASKFYYSDSGPRHVVIFIGEEQPSENGRRYAEGSKAYQMANLVLDVATKLGCSLVFTSGAAVAPTHHTLTPRVWAVPNSEELVQQVRSYENTILMSDLEDREGRGHITGMNGLLLGVARKRGLDAVCLMGEVPAYLQGFPLPYPKASKVVLGVLGRVLGTNIDLRQMDAFIENTQNQVEALYQSFPPQIREQLDKLKQLQPSSGESARTGAPITEEDKKRIMEDIDKMFKKEPKGD
ncbi:MAG: PAC2 family protein [Dehalococcoidia bacterium]|nr:PAC2 family protein [Dehalococcoidia bacterium]